MVMKAYLARSGFALLCLKGLAVFPKGKEGQCASVHSFSLAWLEQPDLSAFPVHLPCCLLV